MLCGGCWREAERPEHPMGFCLPARGLMPEAPEAGGEGGGGAGRATWDLRCHLHPPTPSSERTSSRRSGDRPVSHSFLDSLIHM